MASESGTPIATRTAKRRPTSQAPAANGAEVDASLSHNLYGQRLGRKGRDTRDRIIAGAQAILARPEPVQITLSAVAREASLGMTTLYLYFSDLTELLLAVLEPVMASAEEAYLDQIRTRWPDETLGEHCSAFMVAYRDFWLQHARILHLRNAMADQHDQRMMHYRVDSARTLIDMVAQQMDSDPADPWSQGYDMATALMTGIERVVTVASDIHMQGLKGARSDRDEIDARRLQAVSRLLELGIRDVREAQAGR